MNRPVRAVLLNDTSSSRHLGCRLVVAQIRRLAARHGIEITATCSVYRHWREVEPQLRQADLCLVNGEGTIHHSRPKGVWLADAAPFCRQIELPCVLLNATCQENDPQTNEKIGQFSRVYVREEFSRCYLEEQGVASTVVPDLVFSAEVPPAAGSGRRGILFGDSVDDRLSRELFRLCREAGEEARFFPLEAHRPRLRSREGPRRLLKSLKKRLLFDLRSALARGAAFASPALVPPVLDYQRAVARVPDPETFLRELGEREFHVTGRFHGVCLSLLAGTPFLAAASNTFKIESMLADCGVRDRVVFDVRELRERIREMRPFDKKEKEAIARYVAQARRHIDAMFAEAAALAERRGD